MRLPLKSLVAAFAAVAVLVTAGVVGTPQPALAAADPSFRVVCYPTAMAANDPIVYPGQAGRSHMHSFYGARGVTENTTVESLFAQSGSQCGSNYDSVDLSAYWIPTLYKNGQAIYSDSGGQQLHAYYRRAGGPEGAPVAQAFPQGLRMIAGDMRATTPQGNVSYACAKSDDTGNQRGGTSEFMDCASDEVLIARLVFPDCWDGANLDSADHKSHMAFSGGERASCPSTHPVKLPQVTFEAWYFDVDLSGGGLSWSSGSAYSFHGDIMSAWNAEAAANLVNQCINVAVDCNPLSYPNIPRGEVTQAQVDAQKVGSLPVMQPEPEPDMGDHSGHTPTPTPEPEPTPAPPTTEPTPDPPATSEPVTQPAPSDPETVKIDWRDGDFVSMFIAIRTLYMASFHGRGVRR